MCILAVCTVTKIGNLFCLTNEKIVFYFPYALESRILGGRGLLIRTYFFNGRLYGKALFGPISTIKPIIHPKKCTFVIIIRPKKCSHEKKGIRKTP